MSKEIKKTVTKVLIFIILRFEMLLDNITESFRLYKQKKYK